jgi:hypothetical protein
VIAGAATNAAEAARNERRLSPHIVSKGLLDLRAECLNASDAANFMANDS